MLPLPRSRDFPRAVCFDLYGTLVDISIDTKSSDLWKRLCAELRAGSIIVPPDVLHARYEALVESERKEHGQPFILDHLFFFKLLGAREREDAHVVHYFGRRFRALSTRHLKLQPYALELLSQLRENGCSLALVSNTEEIVTSHDLDELGLREFFETVVLSSAVRVKKPEPRIFHIALQRLGVLPQDCVFVGDDYDCDYRGARKAGLRSVLLCDGQHPAGVPCVRPELPKILEAISCGNPRGEALDCS